jgi:phage recombination protein Bet
VSTALSKAEQNALVVSYDVLGSHVELDLAFVKKYLVRGRSELTTDQELVFFMNTCKMQNLNPLVSGEVYLIKYSKDEPAQMVVGKDAYLRRAFNNPDYLFKNDGITVQRGNNIVQKEGCCLYPSEVLIGGWCRVTFLRGGKERTAFKEVSLQEYNKNMANWKSKPATMVNKVAVSQCVRDAFPKDYEGVYSEEEMVASGAIPAEYTEVTDAPQVNSNETIVMEDDPDATNEQKQELFRAARKHFPENANDVVKGIIQGLGFQSTTGMKVSDVVKAMADLQELIDNSEQPIENAEEPSAQ